MRTIESPEIWFDLASGAPADPQILAKALHSPISGLLVRPSDGAPVEISDRVRRGWLIQGEGELARVSDPGEMVVSPSFDVVSQARSRGHPVGILWRVCDAATLEKACELLAQVDYLFLKLVDETNIPLELVLARAQPTRVRVIKSVETVEEALVALGVLEHGCHGILLAPRDLESVARIAHELTARPTHRLDLVEAEIVGLQYAGMGHRACVDTTTLMATDEGMIVGSTSSGGLLACSEVHPLPYMNTRPFRVNAGAIHSYLWGPGQLAGYLTDLSAGSEVLAVSTSGEARAVRVGRVKIEVRPLLKIEAVSGDVSVNLFAQDDWHVRIFGADGRPSGVTTLKPGDKVLGYVCEPGRHVGIKISETIVEQ